MAYTSKYYLMEQFPILYFSTDDVLNTINNETEKLEMKSQEGYVLKYLN